MGIRPTGFLASGRLYDEFGEDFQIRGTKDMTLGEVVAFIGPQDAIAWPPTLTMDDGGHGGDGFGTVFFSILDTIDTAMQVAGYVTVGIAACRRLRAIRLREEATLPSEPCAALRERLGCAPPAGRTPSNSGDVLVVVRIFGENRSIQCDGATLAATFDGTVLETWIKADGRELRVQVFLEGVEAAVVSLQTVTDIEPMISASLEDIATLRGEKRPNSAPK